MIQLRNKEQILQQPCSRNLEQATKQHQRCSTPEVFQISLWQNLDGDVENYKPDNSANFNLKYPGSGVTNTNKQTNDDDCIYIYIYIDAADELPTWNTVSSNNLTK